MRFSAATTADRVLPEALALRVRPALARLDDALLGPDARAEAGRVSLIAFAIRLVNAAIAFVSQVLLARWMGSFEYGIFVLVWVAVLIVGNLACFGFHTSVIRFVPEYRERGMTAELRGVLFASRVFSLLAATAVAALAIAALLAFPGLSAGYYAVPFILGALCLPMVALSDVLQGISRAYSWALSALSPSYITRPVLILLFMAAALFLGYPADARTALAAAVLACYLTTVIQLVTVTQRVDAGISPGPRRVLFSHWLAVSFPIFLVEGFFFLLTNADVLLVGHFMQPDDVGIYYAAVKTLALVHFVYFAVKAGAAQRYAAFTHGDHDRLPAFARETVSWTFWPSLAMAALVLAIGEPVLKLFGPGFEGGYPLLFVLVGGVVARAAVGPAESLLTMSGHQNACALVYALTLALNVALSFALIPAFGLWGAAIATSASMAFEAATLSFTVWRKLGIAMVIFAPAIRRTGGI